eukprot:scaffold182138_cov41-Prasinocladus_malaysianus.AAC.1
MFSAPDSSDAPHGQLAAAAAASAAAGDNEDAPYYHHRPEPAAAASSDSETPDNVSCAREIPQQPLVNHNQHSKHECQGSHDEFYN